MLLKNKRSGSLLEVESIDDLINPLAAELVAQDQAGQEEQAPERVPKQDLAFPSDEPLPRCWVDPNFKDLRKPK